MFEVPEAKRVKRSDLLDQDADEQSTLAEAVSPEGGHKDDPIDEGDKLIDYGFEYDFIAPSAPPAEPTPDDQDHSYEFRLFATTTKPTGDTSTTSKGQIDTKPTRIGPRITLVRSPSPTSLALTEEGRFLHPRHESHYLATASPTLLAQYKASAISLTTLSALAHTRWPGTSLPWRVTHLPLSRLAKSLRQQHHHHPHHATTTTSPLATRKTSKPNKKRRILLRQPLTARTAPSQPKPKPKPKPLTRTPTGEIELSPEEREKRTARTREKKLKRRQRERDRKAASGGAAGDEQQGGNDDDDNGGAGESLQ